MDRSRIIVLAVAAVAAGAVALLARSLLGGGTPQTAAAPAPQVVMSEVLVAVGNLTPGAQLTAANVRWQDWPKASIDPSFITQAAAPDINKFVQGTVVRAPMMAGEPLAATKIVHGDASGYLAAQLMPGMRAVSVTISADTGAGGFILPNDRVDILCTQQTNEAHKFRTQTVLKDVRVLAVDQTYDSKDSKTVVDEPRPSNSSQSRSNCWNAPKPRARCRSRYARWATTRRRLRPPNPSRTTTPAREKSKSSATASNARPSSARRSRRCALPS